MLISIYYVRVKIICSIFFFFSSRRRHTSSLCDWSSDVCSSDLDVHLMVVDPLRFLEAFATAGADHLIVHLEAVADPQRSRSEERRVGKECRALTDRCDYSRQQDDGQELDVDADQQ